MSDLLTTHASEVTEDQIDHLGHMNVRYYAENAPAGTRAMLDALPGWGRRPVVVHDVYTRHHREQLLGTALIVRSAVLGRTARGCGCTTSWPPATPGCWPRRSSTAPARSTRGRGARLSDRLVAAAQDPCCRRPCRTPPRARSRWMPTSPRRPRRWTRSGRGLAVRRERLVTAEECDAAGRYIPEMAPMLVWGGVARPDSGPWLEEMPGGSLGDGPRWRPASRPAGCRGWASGCRASAPPWPCTTR